MTPVEALACRRCGRRYPPDDVAYTCPEHDGVGGVLDVEYDHDGVLDGVDRRGWTQTDPRIDDVWTFERLLPVDGDPVSLGAGGTPLLDAPALGDSLGVDAAVKDETGNPTGSTKDRASAVLVTRARQRGHDVVTCASTGNAAASVAGYAARAGLDCRIFVPAGLPDAKAVQPRLYGATVLGVDGSYGDAYDLCRTVADERGWYNCNAAMNPYAVEGLRTLGFELAVGAPDADWVVVPMGNGCSLAAVWKGLREFELLGITDGTPRMLGVQAAGATPIHDRFVGGGDTAEERVASDETVAAAGTTADSIDVQEPHNAGRACDALAASGGESVVVTDDAIAEAQRELGATEGVFVEPASAAAVAGVRRARESGVIEPGERVVVVGTGTGLKDTETARRGGPEVRTVGTDPADVPAEF